MRLLLVEDECDLSNALVAFFKHNNFSVDAVYNGIDAIDYIKSGIYDMIILDIMLPKMSGLEVLKNIRNDNIRTPVLILSAKSEIEDKVQGLDYGADDYLTKPFSMKELLARVRALTRRVDAPTSLDNNLTFGNIVLNRTNYELSSVKGKIELRNKEYQMLEMLITSKNHILTVEAFMEKIWGFNTETDYNIVWVNMSYLRKKLVQIGANVQIKVKRNLGYCLEIIDD